ncbi:hypothetical protein BHQ17_23680 [Mycolicibacterium holsaticum]|uniref:Uncharacterized protein n=2 Tax=Mycolicibacterium holsaticum TaxID=152142 RepID=A0A1E3R7H9_9MYCO|nr:hypothetical protein BHQ17_23680 [Mycolicibacterium holsaticum]
MYLVKPNYSLQWTTIAGYSPEKIVEMGGNLEAIPDWKVADNPATAIDVAVALRYGIPVRDGIVVDAIYILDQHRADELRRLHENVVKSHDHPTIKATDDFIDKYLAPGWKQRGEELAQDIAEGNQRSVREAEAKAKRDLEAPMKEELIEHWTSLGGFVP